jgi:hypothetical protein
MTGQDALKVARRDLESDGLSFKQQEALDAVIRCERAAAVEATRPEIERAARVKALEWALKWADIRPYLGEGGFIGLSGAKEIEAELARLQAGQEKERDATD